MAKKSKPAGNMKPNNALTVEQTPDETGAQAMARKLLQPTLKNAVAASAFTGKMLGSEFETPGISDYVEHVQSVTRKAADGDLAMASKILAAQAVTLDSMFAELARRAAINMGEYINSAERYGRLALRAQSNCRTTLEALAKLHQPREQTVRHVHVNEGGQAVVANNFHNHTGGQKNAENVDQPHTPETRAAGESAAMLGQDAQGNGVPVPSDQRGEAVPNARGQRQRRAPGKP